MNTQTETSKNYKIFNRHQTLSTMEFDFLWSTAGRLRELLSKWQDECLTHPVHNQLNGLLDGYYYYDAIKNLNQLREDVKERVAVNNLIAKKGGHAKKEYFYTLDHPIQDLLSIYRGIWSRIAEVEEDEMENHRRNLS